MSVITTIRSPPDEEVINGLCSFNNRVSSRTLTRSSLLSILNSGGACTFSTVDSNITSLCIYLDFNTLQGSVRVVCYYSNIDNNSVGIPNEIPIQYTGASQDVTGTVGLIKVDITSVVGDGRGYDKKTVPVGYNPSIDSEITYRKASYDDYKLIDREPPITLECWNRITMDKYVVFKSLIPVSVLILWPNTWSDGDNNFCLSVVCCSTSKFFTRSDELECMKGLAKDMYSAHMLMMMLTDFHREQEMDGVIRVNSTLTGTGIFMSVC